MLKNKTETPKDFELLLHWLDQNREDAGQKYEKIRQKLIRLFAGRGCYEAEELADQTIHRVTLKLPDIIEDYVGEPVRYFYGVADNMHREWLRKQKKITALEFDKADEYRVSDPDPAYDCLENCLEKLPANQHRLIVNYYQDQKRTRIELRKKMADELGINENTLQIRMFRIRARLRECAEDCLAANSK